MQKSDIRRTMKQRIAALSFDHKDRESSLIINKLKWFCDDMQKIWAYLALDSEPNLDPLIQQRLDQSKEIYVPWVCDDTDTSPYMVRLERREDIVMYHHQRTVRWWIPLSGWLDVIICPWRAFTQQWQRLGRWGGRYDRVLYDHLDAIIYWVCFDIQLMPELPVQEHDMPMHHIITWA